MDNNIKLAIDALQTKYNISIGEASKILPPEELSPEQKESLKNIKDLSKRPEELKLVLGYIFELEHERPISYEIWKNNLCRKLGWESQLSRSISRVLVELAKKELVIQWHGDRNRQLGYMLDEKGLHFLGIYPKKSQPQKSPETSLVVANNEPQLMNIGTLLETESDMFMKFAEIGEKLKDNRKKKHELLTQIAILDEEYDFIVQEVKDDLLLSKVLGNIHNLA